MNKQSNIRLLLSPLRRHWFLLTTLLLASWLWATQELVWAAPVALPQNQTLPRPYSDDFNQCALNGSTWSLIDPVGDATLFMNGEQAELSVPAGVNHDIWVAGNRAPRLMQAATNENFELEAKFVSQLQGRHQIQGLLIEEDDERFLRVNFQYDGTSTRLFAASFVTETATTLLPTTHFNVLIPNAGRAPLYLRLLRQSDNWRASYSYDGVTWASDPAMSFATALTVRSVGVFVGNAGNNPAFTGIVDYFFNRLAPINPEDPVIRTLPVYTVGEGQVAKSCGSPITLTAQPQPGWNFGGWSGSLTGASNPATLALTGREVVTATFVPKPIQLVVNVSGRGKVTWSPNQRYFDGGEVVQFTATADPDWVFVGWTGALVGSETTKSLTMDSSKTVTARFASLTSSGIESDDFNQCALDTIRWTFVDPRNDATLTMNGQQARLKVPEGVGHDIWTDGANAPRIMQLTRNVDFELTVKFESLLFRRFQMQGLVAEQDAQNLARFNFQWSGSALEVTAITLKKGNPTVHHKATIDLSNPMYLRVTRVGDQWTTHYSGDGSSWQSLPSFIFPLAVAQVGAFAGNAGGNPEHTAVIDYIFLTEAPIDPEDATAIQLTTAATGEGTVEHSPRKDRYDCGEPVTLQAVPATGWEFVEWRGDLTGNTNPATVTLAASKSVEALFAQRTYTLQTGVQGQGEILINTLKPEYTHGETVTIQAMPAPGWRFVRWEGDLSGDNTSATITIAQDSVVTAIFAPLAGAAQTLYLPLIAR